MLIIIKVKLKVAGYYSSTFLMTKSQVLSKFCKQNFSFTNQHILVLSQCFMGKERLAHVSVRSKYQPSLKSVKVNPPSCSYPTGSSYSSWGFGSGPVITVLQVMLEAWHSISKSYPLMNTFTFLTFTRPLAITRDVSATLFKSTHLHS